MQILRHAVFAAVPSSEGGCAHHRLLVLAEDGGSSLVGLWSGPADGRLRREWLRTSPSTKEATAIFDDVVQKIWGADGPLHPAPANVQPILDRLASSGESGMRGFALPRTSVPAAPSRQRLISWAKLRAAALETSSTLAFLPAGAERAFCALDASGRASLLLPDAAGQLLEAIITGDDAAADTLLPDRPWWDDAPVLPSTTFDGFIEDLSPKPIPAGASTDTTSSDGDFIYWVADLVRYRGTDLTDLSLAERLTLRDQALAELAAGERLPARWRPVTHFARPGDRASLTDASIAAEASPLPLLAVRNLEAAYRSRGVGDLHIARLAEAGA